MKRIDVDRFARNQRLTEFSGVKLPIWTMWSELVGGDSPSR